MKSLADSRSKTVHCVFDYRLRPTVISPGLQNWLIKLRWWMKYFELKIAFALSGQNCVHCTICALNNRSGKCEVYDSYNGMRLLRTYRVQLDQFLFLTLLWIIFNSTVSCTILCFVAMIVLKTRICDKWMIHLWSIHIFITWMILVDLCRFQTRF